ncbi:esterase [Spirochaetia bacterium]|nr:esterase [Spirochaetia bacterium]
MKTIASFLQQSVDVGACPGASWVVGNGETVLEQGAVGVLGQGLGPVKPDSIYDIASMTKILVTLALMRQLEDGLVRLNDTVGVFFPEYRNAMYDKADITLHELLTHTSVISSLHRLYRHVHTREDVFEAIFLSENRTDGKVRYTCEGYIVLGEIVSRIDGAPLDEVVRKRVLEPLGMSDTGYNPSAALMERIAPTEYCPWRGKMVRGQVHDETAVVLGGVSGNAGVFSTAADIAKVAVMMLNPKARGSFLQPPTIKMMTRNYTEGKGSNRGIGWLLAGSDAPGGDLMSSRGFGHTGFTGTSIWVDPDAGLYGILLANRVHPTRENAAFFRVRSIFHNLIVLNYGL